MKLKHSQAISAVAVAVVTALAGCASHAPQRPATAETVAEHVGRASKLAGDDLKYLLPVCNPQPAKRAGPAEVDVVVRRMLARPAPAPAQVFDNLYFVGSAWVSAWVLKTSDGLILIDALNNEAEAQVLIEGGMKALGLDPAQIKYLVITHGHGDHYGAAAAFVRKYGVRLVASEIDWRMMQTTLEFDAVSWDRPPRRGPRDIGVKDGDTLTLGDTTIHFQVTPGHTLGTLSPTFDVRSGGRTHKALMWGGTAFNFGRDLDRLGSYIAETERMRGVVATRRIDTLLSNHPGSDGTVDKIQRLKAGTGAVHPFVGGQATVDRGLQVLGECAKAQRDRFLSGT
jgi:metallo-beta-lactamase class B